MENDIIDWLKSGDIIIDYLVDKYLYDRKNFKHNDKGYIEKYLDLYNQETKEWGGGIYSPLWLSSHYTLLELKYMEISYEHPFYREASIKLLEGLWFNEGKVSQRRFQDMYMSAMLLSILSYGKINNPKLNEIVDYILEHQMEDSGWNCVWDSTSNKSTKSSFHTTISVLEGLADYLRNEFIHRKEEVVKKIAEGQEYILERKLIYSLSRERIADEDFLYFHYPVRYRYDYFRALEYFVDNNYAYDARMNEAMTILINVLDKGPISVGKQYSGKKHFRLETTRNSRFNTFRALKIIKEYSPSKFSEYIKK